MKRIIFFVFLFYSWLMQAQNDTSIIVDKIVAKVGDRIILLSDIEGMYLQYLSEGNSASKQVKCNILEQLLVQKLLLNQADIDSVYITDDELEQQVDARLNIFIQQMGSQAALEKYLNKSIFQIKSDLKDVLEEQLRAEKEKDNIIGKVEITPSEVRNFYEQLPKDSLPIIDAQVEVQQIVLKPKLTPEEEELTMQKLREIRQKILNGTKFEAMARLYSQDEASARKGGEIGYHTRAELEPEFAAVAFSLKKGQVSDIVKTKYGYHIIQLIDRKGERVNVRHILIRPTIPLEAIKRTIKLADSIRTLILNDSISFEKAAEKFSDDEQTKNNGGLLFNPQTGSAKFNVNDLPNNIKFDIKDLKVGQISKPIKTTDNTGNIVIKIYKIKQKIPPHRADLTHDYQTIMNMALQHKKNKIFDQWVRNKQKQTYISIDKDFQDCSFKYKNWIKKH